MDFTFSKEHEMARILFREFAHKEVKPLAKEVDETEIFPRETVEKMRQYGFMGIPVPKELGGQGCDTMTYILAVEELSKVCGTTGVILSAHTSLAHRPVYEVRHTRAEGKIPAGRWPPARSSAPSA